jgi:hypothetical protein
MSENHDQLEVLIKQLPKRRAIEVNDTATFYLERDPIRESMTLPRVQQYFLFGLLRMGRWWNRNEEYPIGYIVHSLKKMFSRDEVWQGLNLCIRDDYLEVAESKIYAFRA